MRVAGEITRHCRSRSCVCGRHWVAILAFYSDRGVFVLAASRDLRWQWWPTYYEKFLDEDVSLPIRGIAWGWMLAEIVTDEGGHRDRLRKLVHMPA